MLQQVILYFKGLECRKAVSYQKKIEVGAYQYVYACIQRKCGFDSLVFTYFLEKEFLSCSVS
jgi:hypothetical protein